MEIRMRFLLLRQIDGIHRANESNKAKDVPTLIEESNTAAVLWTVR